MTDNTFIDSGLIRKPYPRHIRLAIEQVEAFLKWNVFLDLCEEKPGTDEWYVATQRLTEGLALGMRLAFPSIKAPKFWFSGSNLFHYYLVKGKYKEARRCYYCGMLPDGTTGTYRDELKQLLTVYTQKVPTAFVKSEERSLEQCFESWGVRRKFKERGVEATLDNLRYFAFYSYMMYIWTLLAGGKWDIFEQEVQALIDWAEEKLDTRTVKELNRFGRKHGMLIPNPLPTVYLMPFKHWILGRRNPTKAETHARVALEDCINLYANAHFATADASLGNAVQKEFLLSFVMRIDLGLDLEACRRFARFFLPHLLMYPHIAPKLASWEMEFEPLDPTTALDQEGACALDEKYACAALLWLNEHVYRKK